MIYEATKAAHLLSLFVWIGGLISVALALQYPSQNFMKMVKGYDRAISTPAMILALLFGILLGVQGGWFTSTWLGMKIVLVLALSGLHGALVGKLRRAIWESTGDEVKGSRVFLPVGLAILSGIILLVTFKPG